MKTLIRNIGQLVSGDIEHPRLAGDSLVIVDGTVAAIGQGLEDDADSVIDAHGTTVMPGRPLSHAPRSSIMSSNDAFHQCSCAMRRL